jgi:mannose/fructose/N-acetylgalactosamine-specific phosphotransferase system component IID
VLVAGGLVGSLVIAKVPLKFGETAVQGILDSLLPNLLPLLLTLGCLALLKKGVKAAYLIFGVLILGLVLGGVGFLTM